MTQARALSAPAELAAPFALFALMPVLPMIVLLADILPRGVALGGKSYAVALAAIVAVAALTTFFALVARRGWRGLIEPPLTLPLLAVIATSTLAGAIGISFRTSSFEIIIEIGNFVAFVAICWRMSDDRLRHGLLYCYFGAGIIASLFAIALTLTRHPPEMFAYQHGRAAGTFLQPNEFGGYLLFFISLALAQAGAPLTLRRLGAIAAAVGIIALALSVSRAAWLGLIVGLPVLVWQLGRRAVVIYVCAAIATLVLGTTTFRDVAHDPSENTSRIAVWRGALRLAERFALTGTGPLGFSKVYPSLKQPDAAVDEVHAHDLPLNVLIENGVLGLAAFGWVVVAAVGQMRRTALEIAPADQERRLLFWGLVAGFIASALQNTIDVVSTFVFLLWWPMLGLMCALSPWRARNAAPNARKSAPAIGVLLVTLALAGCGGAPSPSATPSPTVTPPPQPPYYIVAQALPGQPVELREIHDGQLEYLLRSSQIGYQTAESKGTLRDVVLTFYKGRTVRLRVTAPTAEVLPNSRNVRLSGGVRAASATGAAMTAQTMEYDGNRHVLKAAGKVYAHDERGDSLRGDRAEADLDLHVVHVWSSSGEQTMTFGN